MRVIIFITILLLSASWGYYSISSIVECYKQGGINLLGIGRLHCIDKEILEYRHRD